MHCSAVFEDPLRDAPDSQQQQDLSARRLARMITQGAFHGRDAVLGLKPPDVSLFPIALPDALLAAPPEEMATALRFEAARQTQSDPNELVVDGWPLPAAGRTEHNYMIAAARTDIVRRHADLCESVGLDLLRIDVTPGALLRAAWRNKRFGDDVIWGVLDIGFSNTVLALAIGKHCVFIRSARTTGNTFTAALADALKVDYGEAERLKRSVRLPRDDADRTSAPDQQQDKLLWSILRPSIKSLAREVERAFAYAMESYPDRNPSELFLAGGGARLHGLPASLKKILGIEVDLLDPGADLRPQTLGTPAANQSRAVPSPDTPAAEQQAAFAAPIGLALGDFA